MAGRSAEGVPVGAKESAPLQELRKPTARLKWNATRLRVLGVLGGNTDLVRVPDHVTVLDLQHLTETATGLQRADESIAHRGASVGVFGAVQCVGGGKQPLFFVGRNAAIAFRLALGLDLDAKAVERRRGEDRRRSTTAPVDRVSQDGQGCTSGL